MKLTIGFLSQWCFFFFARSFFCQESPLLGLVLDVEEEDVDEDEEEEGDEKGLLVNELVLE